MLFYSLHVETYAVGKEMFEGEPQNPLYNFAGGVASRLKSKITPT